MVIVQVLFKGNYYVSIERDVSYTFSSFVGEADYIKNSFYVSLYAFILFLSPANIGGLLGLSMGCSLVSIAELIIFPMKKLILAGRSKKKHASSKVDVDNCRV